MVERGKLGMAAQCLERAAKLAPHQDYVHRHLAIVRARINRLPLEERDTEIIDDITWNNIIRDPTSFDNNDPTKGQFLGKTDGVFLNHAVVHNHMGNGKTSTADSLNNHIIHLKAPVKSAENSMKNSLLNDDETAANVAEPIGERNLDKVVHGDVTGLEIDHNRVSKLANSDWSTEISIEYDLYTMRKREKRGNKEMRINGNEWKQF